MYLYLRNNHLKNYQEIYLVKNILINFIIEALRTKHAHWQLIKACQKFIIYFTILLYALLCVILDIFI